MSDRNYWVFGDDNCKFPAMTKEQILTAIQQAVTTGEIKDCDTGFITTVKTINGNPLRFFVGTQSEYELLTSEERYNLFAIITNDTTKESLSNALYNLGKDFEDFKDGILNGDIVVPQARNAYDADKAINADFADKAINADFAECDMQGNNIPFTYLNKKEMVVTKSFPTITEGEVYDITLPAGKSVGDVFAVAVDIPEVSPKCSTMFGLRGASQFDCTGSNLASDFLWFRSIHVDLISKDGSNKIMISNGRSLGIGLDNSVSRTGITYYGNVIVTLYFR